MEVDVEKKIAERRLLRRLVARLVIFSAVVVWILGWLLVGLGLIPTLFPDIWEGDLQLVDPLRWFMLIWFITTFILVGIWVAIKGFRFVGRWEKK